MRRPPRRTGARRGRAGSRARPSARGTAPDRRPFAARCRRSCPEYSGRPLSFRAVSRDCPPDMAGRDRCREDRRRHGMRVSEARAGGSLGHCPSVRSGRVRAKTAGRPRFVSSSDMASLRREFLVRVRIAAVAAVAALGAAGAAMAQTSATPVLKGTVGPGFTISLKDSKGHKVKTLKAGTYSLQITDKGDIHTFSLKQKT